MWFRLASANWTNTGNLGTMDSISGSWTVTCTTSGGIVKTTGDGMVTKGETWTGTFTLSEGAEFTSATLTPSTAGTVTSTTSGTTVTVTIANVSANCTLAVVATGGSSSGGDVPDGAILLSSSGATFSDGMCLNSEEATTYARENYFTYEYIPITAGATYSTTTGAGRGWFFTSSKTAISTLNISTATPQYQFTAPDDAAYISISFAMADPYNAVASTAAITLISGENSGDGESNGESAYYKDTSGTLVEGKSLSAGSYALQDKTGYFTYTNVPVITGTTYKSAGSARVWFLNSAGEGISTLNIYKSEGGNQYEFTVPSGCTQISIDFDTTGVTSPSHTTDSAYLEKLS